MNKTVPLPNGYDTMRFLIAGRGSSVIGTGLTLAKVWATPTGVSLEYRDESGRRHMQYLDKREPDATDYLR